MATVDNQQLGIDFSKKKKKKSSKKKSEELSASAAAAPQDDELNAISKQASELFGMKAQKKKKKKSASKTTETATTTTTTTGDVDDGDDIAALIEQLKTTKVAKKPKKRASVVEKESEQSESLSQQERSDQTKDEDDVTPQTALTALQKMKNSENFGEKSWMKSDRDYLYEEVLDRIFTMIEQSNPDLASGAKKKFRIKPPQIAREPKKTVFVNLKEICESIKRDPDHVISYIFTELSTTGSIDAEHRLIIKGVFNAKNMEIVLKKYIAEYVGCRHCGSLDTTLTRDPNTRLYSLNCGICSANRTVSNIRQGFLANTTPRRRRK